ncbi:MAG: DUF4830 domain-containing protein [Clostridia bacterium]|nr:DUF4830 domain-containing protein [Clostridia bacterium]
MFVVSMKTTRLRLLVTVAAVVFLLVSMLVLSDRQQAAATGAPLAAGSDTARRAALEGLGYEIGPAEAQVREIAIPTEEDEAFATYNLLQLETGYDLSPYRGRRVKCWTYTVTNYPGEQAVQANLYVYKDKIIGGDITSALQGGFSHGLKPMTAG